MISQALVFLKDNLNTYLQASSDGSSAIEDRAVFVDGSEMEPIKFPLGAVSVLLINVEEEKVLRDPDRYRRILVDGTQQKIHPDIRLNLYVLFVARFKRYEDSLSYLSQVIQHFQRCQVFNQQNAPGLSDTIEKLIMELMTMPFSEQNEIWNALRTTYLPSVLYKVKMVVYQDQSGIEQSKVTEIVTDITTEVSQ